MGRRAANAVLRACVLVEHLRIPQKKDIHYDFSLSQSAMEEASWRGPSSTPTASVELDVACAIVNRFRAARRSSMWVKKPVDLSPERTGRRNDRAYRVGVPIAGQGFCRGTKDAEPRAQELPLLQQRRYLRLPP